MAILGGIAGIDAATGAFIAVLFVGAMPAGAAIMSQLFIDAASHYELVPVGAASEAGQGRRGPARA